MKATDGLNGPFENPEDPDGFSISSLDLSKTHRIINTYTVHTVQGETYVI